MPAVTLINSNGREERSSGGCFGFTGRNGSVGNSYPRISAELSQYDITTYRYHIGDQWQGNQEGLNNPVEFIKWLCTGSIWAKYITGHNIEAELTNSSYVDIKTDIPGHCVVGTASAIRLANHHKHFLIPFWNMGIATGCDPAITLLIYYAMYSQVKPDFDIRDGKYTQTLRPGSTLTSINAGSSGSLGLGDDEVMQLNHVHPGMLYSFINGNFEMERRDHGNEQCYAKGTGYHQKILSSFSASKSIQGSGLESIKSLPRYLLGRFYKPLPRASQTRRATSGMGSGVNTPSVGHGVYLSELLGWCKVLTNEIKCYNQFLGWEGR